MAARNFPSQQASVTWQSNNQQSRGSDGAACWHSLAAPVIKANDGKQQDTISAQQWKIKLCNESTDVICPLSAEGEQERQQKKDGGRGRVISCRSIERWKKCVNSAVLVTGRSAAIVAFSVGMHDSSKHYYCMFATLFSPGWSAYEGPDITFLLRFELSNTITKQSDTALMIKIYWSQRTLHLV